MKNWSGVRDALELPSSCTPVHLLAAPDYSEDCLYLNLFRPSTPSNATDSLPLRPMLVFIHGGGFNLGGTFAEGYRTLSQNFVSRGLVVATIQYRLNFFGFFADGIPNGSLQGNLGLWDQREALVWLQRNARAFGADPKRITIWGQSAGSASVAHLSVSRHSRDLFQQAIEQSGSFLSPWALNDRVVHSSLELARERLKCDESGNGTVSERWTVPAAERSKKMKDCLKAVEVADVLFALTMTVSCKEMVVRTTVHTLFMQDMVRPDFEIVTFNPHLDTDFFSNLSIPALLAETPRKPTMIGFNSLEALFLTIEYPDSVFAFKGPLTIEAPTPPGGGVGMPFINRSHLVEFIRNEVHPRLGSRQSTPKPAAQALQDELLRLYAPEGNSSKENYIEEYTQLLSDVLFILPAVWEAQMKAATAAESPIYLFEFDHLSKVHAPKLPFRGVVHAAEYPYTVGTTIFGNYELDEEDQRLKEFMVDAIANFVKTG